MNTVNQEKSILFIPAKYKLGTHEAVDAERKKKVAAYARVSTEQDEQQQSYAAQVEFYTRYISNNPDWEMVEVYADEGVTGTNTKKRDGFNRMINDARSGKIDLILTKSISRFARNTVDTLSTVRELKAIGVEVYFEKENLHTLDPKCEVMLTIMSSLAQEESRSISENVRWGKRKKMMDGEYRILPLYGYKKADENENKNKNYNKSNNESKGKYKTDVAINEEQAEVIRSIYLWFLDGASIGTIARRLEESGIKSPRGNDSWSQSTVESILTNEKYKGDALLQKTFTIDYLTKKVKKNEGELGQYYITNSHPAIISPDIFDLTQYELKRRRPTRNQTTFGGIFAGRLLCGHCGAYFGHKTYHTNKYSYSAWTCLNKHKSRSNCESYSIKETELIDAFSEALNIMRKRPSALEPDYDAYGNKKKKLEDIKAKAEKSLKSTIKKIEDITRANLRGSKDQTTFKAEYDKLVEIATMKKQAVKEAKDNLLQIVASKVKARIMAEALSELNRQEKTSVSISTSNKDNDDAKEFNRDIFNKTIDHIIIRGTRESKEIVFTFMNGKDVTIKKTTVKKATAEHAKPEPVKTIKPARKGA